MVKEIKLFGLANKKNNVNDDKERETTYG
jgi:hypothetical protein